MAVTRTTFNPTVWIGFNAFDIRTSTLSAEFNDFSSAFYGVDLTPGDLGLGIGDSSILVRNNRFSGMVGIATNADFSPFPDAPIFNGSIQCLLLNNDIHEVGAVGYLFAPTTYGCLVVGEVNGSAAGNLAAHKIIDVKR